MGNVNEGDGNYVLDIMGGCPMVVNHHKPHLGGNMAGGDEATDFSSDLWPWMVEKFGISSLFDVGCAEGHALKAFQKLGVKKLLGLEGLERNAKKCAPIEVIVHDLTEGPFIVEGYDWVWCSDVAEHIEERYVGNLLSTLASGKWVAMVQGNQVMDNSGWHHVNNKPESYWINAMRAFGMETDEELTQEARKQSKRGIWPDLGRIYRNVRHS